MRAALAIVLILAPSSARADDGHGPSVKKGCVGSCSRVHPIKFPIEPEKIGELLTKLATQPAGRESEELETLLFHGTMVREYLDAYGTDPLDEAQAAFLMRELLRQHAMLEVRVIDEDGVIRAHLPPTKIPVGIQFHIEMDETVDLPHPELSGSLARVGLNYVWSRF